MSGLDRVGAGSLSAEEYLGALRDALGHRRHRRVLDDLRSSCDEWTIGDREADPCGPLTDRGCRHIDWPSLAGIGSVFDLCCGLRWTGAGERSGLDAGRVVPEVAGYIALVYLELCAREEAAHDEARVIADVLAIAARCETEPTLFRRYLLGWHERAGRLEWNYDAEHPAFAPLAHTVALGIALGSADDPLVGGRVAAMRAWLDGGVASGRGRFRDFVPGDDRGVWAEVARASARDAREWVAGFME